MERFKKRFKNINVRRKRISEEFTNSLLLDPYKNIPLGTWYSEAELREKIFLTEKVYWKDSRKGLKI